MFYDDNRRWICINGYNGYEYSNDGLLRSMKNYKQNPYGKLLKKYKTISKMKEASLEELEKILPKDTAITFKEFLDNYDK